MKDQENSENKDFSVSSDSISSDSISYDSFASQELEKPQAGLISRVAVGAYNTTTTLLDTTKKVAVPIIGNASWMTGAALSGSVGVVKNVGSYFIPSRFKTVDPKDKSD